MTRPIISRTSHRAHPVYHFVFLELHQAARRNYVTNLGTSNLSKCIIHWNPLKRSRCEFPPLGGVYKIRERFIIINIQESVTTFVRIMYCDTHSFIASTNQADVIGVIRAAANVTLYITDRETSPVTGSYRNRQAADSCAVMRRCLSFPAREISLQLSVLQVRAEHRNGRFANCGENFRKFPESVRV